MSDIHLPDDYALKLADALAAITQKDFERLCAYVRCNLFLVLLHVPYLDAEDLVTEAILRTAQRLRIWNTEISFEQHLISAARSIASSIRIEYNISPHWKDWNSLQHIAEDTEREAAAQQLIDQLRRRLRGDKGATVVLESILEGFKSDEICQRLKITPAVYQAARKRLIRAGEALDRNEQKLEIHHSATTGEKSQ